MTPADNAGGNQDLSSARKGAQNSGSGKPAKKHNSANRKNNKGNQGGKNTPRAKYAKRVDEVSAGGLVVPRMKDYFGRYQKDILNLVNHQRRRQSVRWQRKLESKVRSPDL